MSSVEEIIAYLDSILGYKKKGTTDIDKIIGKLNIQNSQMVRDLIKIVIDDESNNKIEIERKIKDHLNGLKDFKITYEPIKSVKVFMVFSNEFSFGNYFVLDKKARELFNKMVKIISVNQTKQVCMKFNSKYYEILPIEYHKDNFGPWKYDPLAGQLRIYMTKFDNGNFPKYWRLSEDAEISIEDREHTNFNNEDEKHLSENMPLSEFLERVSGNAKLSEILERQYSIKTVKELKKVQENGWTQIQNVLPAHADIVRDAVNKLASESIVSGDDCSNKKQNNSEYGHKWHKLWLSLYFYSKSDYKHLSYLDKDSLNECFEEQKKDKIFDIGPKLDQIKLSLQAYTIPMNKSVMREKSHGMLFYGPPGTGKTKLSNVIINCSGLEALVEPLSSSELNRSLVGATEGLIIAIWNRAKICPHWLCCVAIDEVDALAPKRNDKTAGHKIDSLSILLSVIGGIKDVPNVFVIASTNRLGKIDEAFGRRLQDKFYIGKLTNQQRVSLLKQIVTNPKAELASHVNIDFDNLANLMAKLTTNFSGSALASFRSEIIKYFDLNAHNKRITIINEDTLIDMATKIANDFQIRLGRFYIPELLSSKNSKFDEKIWQDYFYDCVDYFSGRILFDFREDKAMMFFEKQTPKELFEIDLGPKVDFVSDIIPCILDFCIRFNVDHINLIDTDIMTQSSAFDENSISELISDCLNEFEKIETGLVLFDVDTLVGVSVSQSGLDKTSSYSIQNQRLWQNIIHSFRQSYYTPDRNKKKWCVFASSSEFLIQQFKSLTKFPKSEEEKIYEDNLLKEKTEKLECKNCGHCYFEAENDFNSCLYHPEALARLDEQNHPLNKKTMFEILRKQKNPEKVADLAKNYFYLCCMRPFTESRDSGCKQDKHSKVKRVVFDINP